MTVAACWTSTRRAARTVNHLPIRQTLCASFATAKAGIGVTVAVGPQTGAGPSVRRDDAPPPLCRRWARGVRVDQRSSTSHLCTRYAPQARWPFAPPQTPEGRRRPDSKVEPVVTERSLRAAVPCMPTSGAPAPTAFSSLALERAWSGIDLQSHLALIAA
jgi:hypothetical protein